MQSKQALRFLAALSWFAIAALFSQSSARAADFFVSPAGSPRGDGSAAAPWDITTAFENARGVVGPGDTVWLGGGEYAAGRAVRSRLAGEPAVTVRAMRGERPVLLDELILQGGGVRLVNLELRGRLLVEPGAANTELSGCVVRGRVTSLAEARLEGNVLLGGVELAGAFAQIEGNIIAGGDVLSSGSALVVQENVSFRATWAARGCRTLTLRDNHGLATGLGGLACDAQEAMGNDDLDGMVALRVNRNEPGLAFVAIHNRDRAGAVNVELGAMGLEPGQRFAICSVSGAGAEGGTLLEGVFRAGGTVAIPMGGAEFGVFRVEPAADPARTFVTAKPSSLAAPRAAVTPIGVAGAAASFAATGGTPQSAPIAAAFGAPLAVTVVDAAGTPVPGVTVNFATPLSGPRAILSASSAVTNSAGVASVTATANAVTGNYYVTARVAGAAASPAAALDVRSYSINAFNTVYDGQWQGTYAASDGNVYFGASAHTPGHGAGFFKYDPRAEAITVITPDIMVPLGENPALLPSQGKIHSEITEYNGWLYFATHSSNYNSGAALANYTGGHLIGYNLATGQFRDFGVMQANHTIYSGLVLDRTRGKFYVFTTPNVVGFSYAPAPANNRPRLWRVDLATGSKQYLGDVSTTGDASLQMFLDNNGTLWMMPLGNQGLYRVTAASNTVERFAVPSQYVFRYIFALPGSARAVVSYENRNALGYFDPARPVASAFTDIVTLPDGVHTVSLAPDGQTVYYVTGPVPVSGGDRLKAVNLTTGATTDLGLLRDQDGRLPWRVNGFYAAANGKIYAVGDWQRLAGDPASIRNGAVRVSDLNSSQQVTMRIAEIDVTPSVRFNLTNTPGPPASISVTGGAPQSARVASGFAAPLQVTVRDLANNPVAGATVSFAVATPVAGSAGASLSAPTAVTNALGAASVNATANTMAGNYSVTASITGVASTVSFALTNTAGAAASVSATGGTPQSARITEAFATPLQATVRDAWGNGVPGAVVAFAAPATGARATLSAATAVTNAAGVAAVNATAGAVVGNYNVTGSASGVAAPATFVLQNTAGPAASVTATSGTPQSAGVTTAFLLPLQLTVRDAGGNPVAGVTVTYVASGASANAVLSAPSAVTNASGIASVRATANGTAGAYAVTASVAGAATAANFSLTNTTASGVVTAAALIGSDDTTAGNWKGVYGGDGHFIPNLATSYPAYAIVTMTGATPYTWDPNPGGAEAARALERVTPPGRFASALISGGQFELDVQLADGQPHRVALYMTDWQSSTAAQTVTILDKATGAVLHTQSVTGYRAGRWLVYMMRGRVVIRVARTAGSWAQLNGVFFGEGAPAASGGSLAATAGTPQSTQVSTGFAMPLTVTARNSANAPMAGVTVTFAAPTSGASAVLSSASAVTNGSGVATVTAVANGVAGTYNVTATGSNGGAVTAFALTNAAGPAASLSVAGGSGQSARVGTAFGLALRAVVRDAGGNPVPGAVVSFTPPAAGAGAALSSSTATTNAAGEASVTATANGVAGSYSVVASGPGGSASFALTNTAALPSSISVVSGSGQSAVVNASFAMPLRALVRDAGGLPLSGVVVTFTPPASGAGAVLSQGMATTNGAGEASVSATANGTAGSYNVAASAPGVATVANFALTNTVSGGTGGTAAATFLAADSTTAGSWKGVYGSDGYFIPNLATSYPAYATVTRTGAAFTWETNPSGPESIRGLERVVPPGRIGSAIIDGSQLQFDITLTDGLAHRVAFYMVDWQSSTSTQTVMIVDPATNTVLDSRSLASYRAGRWLVYSLRGRVIVRVTRTAGSWAQVNGVFFGQ